MREKGEDLLLMVKPYGTFLTYIPKDFNSYDNLLPKLMYMALPYLY